MTRVSARRIRGKASTMPVFSFDKKTTRMIHAMHQWPDRIKKARVLFLLDVANFFKNTLIDLAPEIMIEESEKNYAEDLVISLLDEDENNANVAIFYNGNYSVLSEKKLDNSALYFRSKMNSPKWVRALTVNGPWPASLVPLATKPEDADVIVRRARSQEIEQLERRILDRKHEIIRQFRSYGENVDITKSTKASGMSVYEDIGFNVLRREFGLDGMPQKAHWRPAFKKTELYIKKTIPKVVKYVISGNDSLFHLPDEIGPMNWKKYKLGEGFIKEISPFSPWKVKDLK